MKADELIYSPVGMAEEDKQFLWEMIATALGADFLEEKDMNDLRQQLFAELGEAGRIEIHNKSDIRASLQEWENTSKY